MDYLSSKARPLLQLDMKISCGWQPVICSHLGYKKLRALFSDTWWYMIESQRHSYDLGDPSSWPISDACCVTLQY